MNDLSVEQIRHGIALMAKSDTRYPLTPGMFRNLAVTYRPAEKKQPIAVADASPKGLAWRAVLSRFALRLSGMKPPGETRTDFDVESIIDSIYWDDGERRRAIAEGFSSVHRFDQRLFDQLKRAFEGAW